METENTLLTVDQVAEMAHVQPRTIRAKIHQGVLRAHKPPHAKSWLIRRADAEGMLTGERAPVDLSKSPLIDRMGTPEGRARAVAMLRTLGDDWDETEQRAAAAILQKALAENPIQMRRWDPETGIQRDDVD